MQVLQAIFLGVLQGLTEFLPVSSSGHLLMAQKLLGVEPSLTMSILLHLGTLIAVLVVFWRDWWAILKNPFKSHVFRMLVVATLPAVAATLLLENIVTTQSSKYSSGLVLGICFLFTAVLLFVAEAWAARHTRSGRRHKKQDVEDVTLKQALAMGGMQAVAILPGVSRSGATIVGGLFSGLDRTLAAKFSFMMSVPAILGGLVFDLKDMITGDTTAFSEGILAPLVGILVAGVVGYVTIRWMLKLLQRVSLRVFGIYTAVVGLLIILDSTVFHRFF